MCSCLGTDIDPKNQQQRKRIICKVYIQTVLMKYKRDLFYLYLPNIKVTEFFMFSFFLTKSNELECSHQFRKC